jgi:glycosyltransferase involved in cell wall biosynthesis
MFAMMRPEGYLLLMSKPLALSLIIPAYNEHEHLGYCLDTIAAQTIMPYEVIVVDNNSTDDTVKIAHSYPFVKIVQAKNQGIVYARDAGFDAAKGTIIGRIDADCRLPRDWVEQVLAFYEDPANNNTALTGGGTFYNVLFPRISRHILGLLAFWVNRIALGHHFLYGSNMAFPAQIWPEVKHKICIRNDIHEDIDIAVHMHDAGIKIVYRPKLQVGVKLRRVFQDHDKLWAYLMLWPTSLKIHNKILWPTGFIGAVLLYILAPLLYPVNWLREIRLRLFARNR